MNTSMMKIVLVTVVSVGLINVWADEEEKEATFPTETTATELTEEQQKEAGDLLKKASKLYGEVLDNNSAGEIDRLRQNHGFLDSRIDKMTKDLVRYRAEVARVDKETEDKLKAIAGMGLSEKEQKTRTSDVLRLRKKRLARVEFRIEGLADHLKDLTEQRDEIAVGIKDKQEFPTQREETEEEKLQRDWEERKAAKQDAASAAKQAEIDARFKRHSN